MSFFKTFFMLAALAVSGLANAAIIPYYYSVDNAYIGDGGDPSNPWSNTFYDGPALSTGWPDYKDYSFGQGTLNDGINPSSRENNQLFPQDSDVPSMISVYLDSYANPNSPAFISIFGWGEEDLDSSIPGSLLSFTMESAYGIQTINSTSFGNQGQNDLFDLSDIWDGSKYITLFSMYNFVTVDGGAFNIGEMVISDSDGIPDSFFLSYSDYFPNDGTASVPESPILWLFVVAGLAWFFSNKGQKITFKQGNITFA